MADPRGRPVGGDAVEISGPWQHRYVAANGARFHVAESGPHDGPMVLLLHGFPEFWWCWRAQLPVLADSGYRAVAMDLRGYAGSDKTPDGYDPITLSQDVSGVVKALGARSAVLVGHGWGGYVGWATAVLHPREVSALCAVSAPHPLSMLSSLRSGLRSPGVRHLLAAQVPVLPERRLADPDTGHLAEHLRSWSGPDSSFPDRATVETYQRALARWPAPHCALEYHRWLVRSRLRADGRRFDALMRRPVTQPVCCVVGDRDQVIPESALRSTQSRVGGRLTLHRVPDAGHFPHEEAPHVFGRLLLDWLRSL